MTASKRQRVGVKVSAQGQASGLDNQGMAGAMVPLEAALNDAVGARVRISTSPVASTIEGTLFTADPVTNLVAINTADSKLSQAGNYHVIPISRIQSFQLLSLAPSSQDNESSPSVPESLPSLHALDIRALKAREANAVSKIQEGEARRGKGVTQEAQDIFNAISRTMPTRWNGTNIVVADAVTIAHPYNKEDCRALVAGDKAALERVQKVLEMERKKIELRNASAMIGSANTFNRTANNPRNPPNAPSTSGPGAAGPKKGG
ncbi:anticodon-binding domain-containing protein [Aspergillus egyptiacus]|nr:anticodon-binding domain-containing protein [Aspergillus egyptiacus]